MNTSNEIWIASYIPNKIGWKYLKWTLESCKVFTNISIHISIFYDDLNIDELKSIIPNINIYQQKEKVTQFDGYDTIYNTRKNCGNPEDIILFLDDDDLLLPNAFDELLNDISIGGKVGLQYLPLKDADDYCNITINQLSKFIETNADNIELVDDFSGTVIRRKYLDDFFKDDSLASKLIKVFGVYDTQFMNYVESLPNGGISNIPTVYHRIKEYKSPWMN